MFSDAIIVIDHDGPIESTLISDSLLAIETALREANKSLLNNILCRHPEETAKFFSSTSEELEKDRKPYLYNYQLGDLEYSYELVRPHIQSKKPTTIGAKIRNAAFSAIIGTAVVVGGPAIVDSEPYKDAQHGITENVDELYGYIREQLGMANLEREIKCEKQGDTIIFIIVPTEKEKNRYDLLDKGKG